MNLFKTSTLRAAALIAAAILITHVWADTGDWSIDYSSDSVTEAVCPDSDTDGVCNIADNCPAVANSD